MEEQRLAFQEALKVRIDRNLRAFERRSITDVGLRAAAVAVVVLPGDQQEACFVLTRRAAGLRSHGGQWALPGGRCDPGETVVETALREVREEVGLAMAPANLLGLLDDYATRSGFVITPVVLWVSEDGPLSLDPREVAAAYRVPLAELEAPHVRAIPESDRPVIAVRLLGTFIHAPTAAILYQLREVALFGRDTRVAHFEQPVFAWR
jgi:8-oxo-dGTP pyrophosphatase MutT (NUDIX family)